MSVVPLNAEEVPEIDEPTGEILDGLEIVGYWSLGRSVVFRRNPNDPLVLMSAGFIKRLAARLEEDGR